MMPNLQAEYESTVRSQVPRMLDETSMSSSMTRPYSRPRLVSEALALLADEKACVLAGGTDLVIMRAQSMVDVESIVDIKGIASLAQIEFSAEGIRVGAGVSLDALSSHPNFGPNAITDGARVVGGWQTRCRATIGGNICRASPAADTLCGVLVLSGELELASVSGTRMISSADFFTGPGRTVMRHGELLTSIVISGKEGRMGGSAYRRFTYRNAMDLSVAGVAVALELDGDRCVAARIAVGACGPTPFLVSDAAAALIGSTINDRALAAAADALMSAAKPIDDVRGTRRHRLHVLRPLLFSAAADALARASRKAQAEGGQ